MPISSTATRSAANQSGNDNAHAMIDRRAAHRTVAFHPVVAVDHRQVRVQPLGQREQIVVDAADAAAVDDRLVGDLAGLGGPLAAAEARILDRRAEDDVLQRQRGHDQIVRLQLGGGDDEVVAVEQAAATSAPRAAGSPFGRRREHVLDGCWSKIDAASTPYLAASGG